MAMSSFFSLFPFSNHQWDLSNYFLRAVDSAWLPLDSSGSLQHQITELLPSRLRPMVCYRLRLGGYVFHQLLPSQLRPMVCYRLQFWVDILTLQILPSRLRPMVLQPPAAWVETLFSV